MLVKWDYIVETWDCMLAKSDYMLVRLENTAEMLGCKLAKLDCRQDLPESSSGM
jgi:hypothetical protein